MQWIRDALGLASSHSSSWHRPWGRNRGPVLFWFLSVGAWISEIALDWWKGSGSAIAAALFRSSCEILKRLLVETCRTEWVWAMLDVTMAGGSTAVPLQAGRQET